MCSLFLDSTKLMLSGLVTPEMSENTCLKNLRLTWKEPGLAIGLGSKPVFYNNNPMTLSLPYSFDFHSCLAKLLSPPLITL